MKNTSRIYKILFIVMLTTIGLMSCNKDIDLAPESNYNTKDFYKSENDFTLAIAGTYGGLRGIHSYQYPIVVESLSDNISTSTNNPYTRLTFNDGDANVLSLWSAYWTIINRTNNILDQIDGGEFSTPTLQNRIKGEALFIRGFCYFQMAWLFGGVPLVDRVTPEHELLQLTRTSQAETFAFAAQNLDAAATLLPEENSGGNLGRATKFSALGLLGRLHLFTKDYNKAKEALSLVIQSENYGMYPDYKDCFLNTKDNGIEHVFQIQYTERLINQGNPLVYTLVPENIRSPQFPSGGRSLWLAVSNDLYEAYEEGDLRRDITIQKGYVTSSNVTDENTLLYIKYAHGTVPGLPEDNDVNLSVLRYTDVLLMYAESLNELEYEADGEALSILNAVRERADLDFYDPSDLTTQDQFREALFKERRVEFACEFFRWFDLIRQGSDKTSSIMTNFLNRTDEGSGTYVFDDKFMLLPIPAAERQVNSSLDPNPGY